MLTLNLTPFLFGTKLTSRRPPQPEMTLVVRGAFALRPGEPLTPLEDQGKLTGDVFHDDDDERAGECLYASDFADFKLNAEVLLRGACHAPGGRAAASLPVRLSVGGWSKTLRVMGTRAWSDDGSGAAMSSPLPFTRVPLDYAHAFGGAGYAANPAGKGLRTRELPNVEHPDRYVRARGDAPEPAGFGPINPGWPHRARKIGEQYGAAYREKRAPYYAEDLDWTYFHAAPDDQQIQGYLRGDEEVSLVNVHPGAPSLATRLPGLRIRVFVNDVVHRLREAPMALDTLYASPDEGILRLTWRGVVPVKEDDFADVKVVIVASEPLAERPRPEAYYLAKLEQIERDPLGIEADIRSALPPREADATLALIERHRRGQAAEAADVEGRDPLSALLEKKLGDLRAEDQERLRGAIAELKKKAPPGVDPDASLARAVQAIEDAPPVAVPIKPGVLPDLRIRDKVRRVMATVEAIKKTAAEQKIAIPEGKLAELEAIPDHPRWREVDPSYAPPGPVSTDEPGPGRDLSEQDLSRRDLSGMDLSGANLSSANLTGANLRGANLRGARLERAILYKADLTGADLTKADLTQVNAAAARAVDADLSGANLEIAFFEDADLSGAILRGAQGSHVVFTRAKLARARASGAQLDRSDFSEGSLEGADLSGASLVACQLERCRAAGIDLSGARIRGARFEGADLTRAVLRQARGERCLFSKAILDEADGTLASLERSHFNEASAVGARFSGANLKECRFHRARLERAEIVESNLFGADLSKAQLGGAKFNRSNLYEARFSGARSAGCDFNGANLRRSTLEKA
jgi:uncharacterized protein YjbI with pentapeptide repeats